MKFSDEQLDQYAAVLVTSSMEMFNLRKADSFGTVNRHMAEAVASAAVTDVLTRMIAAAEHRQAGFWENGAYKESILWAGRAAWARLFMPTPTPAPTAEEGETE